MRVSWAAAVIFGVIASSCGSSQQLPDAGPVVTVRLPVGSVLNAQETLDKTTTALDSPPTGEPEVLELDDIVPDDAFVEPDEGAVGNTPPNSSILPGEIPASAFNIEDYRPDPNNPAWIAALDALRTYRPFVEENGWHVIVEGFTDSLGSVEYNLQLSQQRADAVREIMINELDYKPELVQAFGRGVGGDSADNRKVTIKFVRGEQA